MLRSLRDDGDEPNVPRPVDVRFVGSPACVAKLEEQISSMGWRVVQRVTVDADSKVLDVQRGQTTGPAAIRRLTEAALEIEARFCVRYDGWGTVATKR
ncbi:ribonuclease E inhibitor RraB [Sphingomonas citri]